MNYVIILCLCLFSIGYVNYVIILCLLCLFNIGYVKLRINSLLIMIDMLSLLPETVLLATRKNSAVFLILVTAIRAPTI